MSHLIASKAVITDLEILKKAVHGSGFLTWNDGETTFRSYYSGESLKQQINEIGTCEHSISINVPGCGGYQIGVIRRKDGQGWDLAFDPYDRVAAQKVGAECEVVTTLYSEEFIRDWAEKNGFTTERFIDEDGKICMTMSQ